jgi:hypothetical protein
MQTRNFVMQFSENETFAFGQGRAKSSPESSALNTPKVDKRYEFTASESNHGCASALRGNLMGEFDNVADDVRHEDASSGERVVGIGSRKHWQSSSSSTRKSFSVNAAGHGSHGKGHSGAAGGKSRGNHQGRIYIRVVDAPRNSHRDISSTVDDLISAMKLVLGVSKVSTSSYFPDDAESGEPVDPAEDADNACRDGDTDRDRGDSGHGNQTSGDGDGFDVARALTDKAHPYQSVNSSGSAKEGSKMAVTKRSDASVNLTRSFSETTSAATSASASASASTSLGYSSSSSSSSSAHFPSSSSSSTSSSSRSRSAYWLVRKPGPEAIKLEANHTSTAVVFGSLRGIPMSSSIARLSLNESEYAKKSQSDSQIPAQKAEDEAFVRQRIRSLPVMSNRAVLLQELCGSRSGSPQRSNDDSGVSVGTNMKGTKEPQPLSVNAALKVQPTAVAMAASNQSPKTAARETSSGLTTIDSIIRIELALQNSRELRADIENRLVDSLQSRELHMEKLNYIQSLRFMIDNPPSVPSRNLPAVDQVLFDSLLCPS